MRYQGRITEWRDDKGFGFITPNGGGERVFVHISAIRPASRRPAVNQLVNFERTVDEKGRPNASKVQYASVGKPPAAAPPVRRLPAWPVALAFLGAVAALVYLGKLPMLVLAVYGVASVVAFGMYARDKYAAQRGQWRTPESTLQLLALAGGWPGALVAQQQLRHKSSKASFLLVFRGAVVLNLVGLGWLLTADGARLIAQAGG